MKQELEQLASSSPAFTSGSHTDRLRAFAWFLHSARGVDRFSTGDIASCFEAMQLERPTNLSQLIANLEGSSPKQMLKDRGGYYLARGVREELERKFGGRPATVAIEKMLLELPAKVTNIDERVFLDETLRCLRAGAFRASIVMAWNLAYDHFTRFVFDKHLAKFNTQWPVSYAKLHQKARIPAISKPEDFAELKESEVIQIARAGAIISGDVAKILDEKLGRRNSAAHPSSVLFTQVQAEAYVDDLVRNVVLALV